MFKNLLVTGGSGFIGSAFIRMILKQTPCFVCNLDLLTYAAHPDALQGFENHPNYRFVHGNVLDQALIEKLIQEQRIDAIVHFAAETHVDRSISSAYPFIDTNVKGTLSLLEAVRKFPKVHFHHISTDEVYGSLGHKGSFSETSPYHPNSPYSASKAASDHLVRAFAHTYNLSVTLSHCSNNYGPYQHTEKFIPLMILHCLQGKPLPVYGRGANVRDWLYVDDHAAAVWAILCKGKRGETYDIGGKTELTNLELLELLIELLAAQKGESPDRYRQLIRFVADRPGHDFRYAIDTSKIERELGWTPKVGLREGLGKVLSLQGIE